MRESLPAEDFEAIRQSVQDWTARVLPRDDFVGSLIYLIARGTRDLERVKLARNVHRRTHIEESAWREVYEAAALGRRLRLDPRVHEYVVVGPGTRSLPGNGNSAPTGAGQIAGPDWLVERLQSTAAGCPWLLERWTEIREWFEPGKRWISADSFKMIKLMGRTPRDVLEDLKRPKSSWRATGSFAAAGAR